MLLCRVGTIYPRLTFRVLLERKSGYYISNVALPLAVLTALGPLSNAIEIDGSSMGTGDRLSVTLTLILTAVAYKFVVAASLPQVSYLTLLDTHVLICFGFLVINVIENVLYPVYAHRYEPDSNVEGIFVVVYLATFVLLNVIFFGAISFKIRCRDKFFEDELAYEYTCRSVQTVIYQQERESREMPGDLVLSQVLQQKGLTKSEEERNTERKKARKVMSFNPLNFFRSPKVVDEDFNDDTASYRLSGDLALIKREYEKVKKKSV